MFELISVIKAAQEDFSSTRRRRLSDSDDTDRVITKYKNELEYLIIEIYYNWLKELKKTLGRMIVPAVVEHQGLPGFIDDAFNNNGFLNKLMGSGTNLTPVSTEKLLSWMSKVYATMRAYHVEDTIR